MTAIGWPDNTLSVFPGAELASLVFDPTVILNTGAGFTLPPKVGYGGLLVCVAFPTVATIGVVVQSTPGVLPKWGKRRPMTYSKETLTWLVPLPIGPTVGYTVDITSSVSQTTKGQVSIYGVGQLPAAVPFRNDLRPYPTGDYMLLGGGTSGTLVPAATSPWRILLRSLSGTFYSTSATGGFLNVKAVVNGSTRRLVRGYSRSNSEDHWTAALPEAGLLLDLNQGVTFTTTRQNGNTITATFDLVA